MRTPEGDNTIEKFLSLATVYPKLKEKVEKNRKNLESTLNDGTKFDVFINVDKVIDRSSRYVKYGATPKIKRYFLVKHLDKVTFNDITKIVGSLNQHFKNHYQVIRVAIISQNYDDEFFTEKIDEKIEKIPTNLNIDLIKEEKKGFRFIGMKIQH